MSLELDFDVLKVMQKYDNYNSYFCYVEEKLLQDETKMILEGYEYYYEKHKKDIALPEFFSIFFNELHKNWDTDTKKYYKNIFKTLSKIEDKEVEPTLRTLKQEQLWGRLCSAKNNDFDIEEMAHVLSTYNDYETSTDADLGIVDLETIWSSETGEVVCPWNLKEMTASWEGMRSSMFYVLMAVTNTGKTWMMLNEVRNFLKHVKDGNVLYVTNEDGADILLLKFMAVLFNKPLSWVRANKDFVRKSYYHHYPHNPLKFVNVGGGKAARRKIESVCKAVKPKLIILDQVDKLMSQTEANNPRGYDYIYSWCRQLARNFEAPTLGVTQYKPVKGRDGEVVNGVMNQHGGFYSTTDKPANTDFMYGVQSNNEDPTTRRIYLIRAKEGTEGQNFLCKFNINTGRITSY